MQDLVDIISYVNNISTVTSKWILDSTRKIEKVDYDIKTQIKLLKMHAKT